jgi:putative transposase
MPRRRDPSVRVVHRTARVRLRLTPGQRRRCWGLLRSAGDVWACVLDANRWRRQAGQPPLVGYQELCRELAGSGPGAFGELDTVGARSVLRRFSDAWFAATRRTAGRDRVRFPRRKRGWVPMRWYNGTFTLHGRRVRIPTAKGAAPLWVRLDREVPYPVEQIRSITLLADAGRLCLEVTAEVPTASYPAGQEPDPARVAGVDLGVIHPFAVAGPKGQGLLVSGRALRAEAHLHLREGKKRRKATARRAPKPGQRGSRRWRKTRRTQRQAEARHRRRISQTRHEATKEVITWAVGQRVGTLVVGDPRGVLGIDAGRRHNRRLRAWAPGAWITILTDKATQAGIHVVLVDERGSSSTCPDPGCGRRVSKPAGRTFNCPHCGLSGHRDLIGATTIARRAPSGGNTAASTPVPAAVTHRRAGRHLPGRGPARRDPRRPPPDGQAVAGSVGRPRPAPHPVGSRSPRGEDQPTPDYRNNVG